MENIYLSIYVGSLLNYISRMYTSRQFLRWLNDHLFTAKPNLNAIFQEFL